MRIANINGCTWSFRSHSTPDRSRAGAKASREHTETCARQMFSLECLLYTLGTLAHAGVTYATVVVPNRSSQSPLSSRCWSENKAFDFMR
jgi:hypothetical protein